MFAKGPEFRVLGSLCVLVLLLTFCESLLAVTYAADDSSFVQLAQNSSNMSAAGAAARITKMTGGQVLSVTTVSSDGGKTHRVKVLLPGGRVKVFRVKVSSG